MLNKLSLVTFTVLISIGFSFAGDMGVKRTPASSRCVTDGENYRPGSKVDVMCFNRALKEKKEQTTFISKSKDMLVLGWKNILFIKYHWRHPKTKKGEWKYNIISGNKSRLVDIEAISVSSDDEQVAVLNKVSSSQKQILVFSSKNSGNVSPMRIMNSSFIDTANAILLDIGRELIYIAGGDKVGAISTNADSRFNNRASKIPNIVKEISGVKSQIVKPKGLALVGDELVVLEASTKNLLAFNANKFGSEAGDTPSWALSVENQGLAGSAHGVKFQFNKIVVYDESGGKAEFVK